MEMDKRGVKIEGNPTQEIDPETKELAQFMESECRVGRDCKYCNNELPCQVLWDRLIQSRPTGKKLEACKMQFTNILKNKVISTTPNRADYTWIPNPNYHGINEIGQVGVVAH